MVQCDHAGVSYINSGWWNASHNGHSSKVFLQYGYSSVACMHLGCWNCCYIVHSCTVSLQCEWVHVFLDYRSDWKISHIFDTDKICSCLSVLTVEDREVMVRGKAAMKWTVFDSHWKLLYLLNQLPSIIILLTIYTLLHKYWDSDNFCNPVSGHCHRRFEMKESQSPTEGHRAGTTVKTYQKRKKYPRCFTSVLL